jgi:chromosome segregation ATPase
LTRFGAAGYPRFGSGGGAIPELAQQSTSTVSDGVSDGGNASELDRLQRAVLELVARYRAIRAENEGLRARIAERDERLRELAERKQDAIQRIDAIVAQIDELDAKIEASETAV